MTASVRRSRMLRRHYKRSLPLPGFSRSPSPPHGIPPGIFKKLPWLSGNGSFGGGGNGGTGGDGDSGHEGGNNGEDNGGGGNNGGSSSGNNGGGSNSNSNSNSNNHSAGSSNGGSGTSNPPSDANQGNSGTLPAPSPSGSSGNSGNGNNSGASTSNSSSGSGKNSSPSATSAPINTGNTPSSSSTHPSSPSAQNTSVGPIVATASSTPLSITSVPPPTSTHPTAPQADLSKHNNHAAIVGGVVGAVIFLFLAFAAWMIYRRHRRNRLPPSAEFINNSASYPFARAGVGNTTNGGEKNETSGGNYGGAGTDAAGQAKFKLFSADSAEGILSEKRPQMGQYRDAYLNQSLPPPPQPEVLYTTPTRVSTPPNAPPAGSAPGTPTTPSGRRIPFGTGTFQFPPRPPQSQLPQRGGPP